MASIIDKVDQLLEIAPELFDLAFIDESILDEYVIVAGGIKDDIKLGDSINDSISGSLQSNPTEDKNGKPRFPKDWGNHLNGFPPPPDAIGFYLPFHYLPNVWGIYLVVEELTKLVRFIEARAPRCSFQQCEKAARLFVYYHEAYHHKIEMLGTRLELISRKPCYKTDIESIYQKGMQRDLCWEETAANVHGLFKTREELSKVKGYGVSVCRELDNALLEYIRGMALNSYHRAADYFRPLKEKRDPVDEWEKREFAFFDDIQLSHFGGTRWEQDVWAFGSFLDYPDNKVNGKVNYLWPKNGPRIPLNGRLLSTRQVVQKLEKQLGQNLEFVRSGKGSHKIYRAKNGGTTVIPRDKNMPVGTLKSILKDLGLNMSVHEFLRV